MGILTRKKDAKTLAANLAGKYDITYGEDPSTYQFVDKDTGKAVAISGYGGVEEGSRLLSPKRRFKRLIGEEVQQQSNLYKPEPEVKIDEEALREEISKNLESKYTGQINALNTEISKLRGKSTKGKGTTRQTNNNNNTKSVVTPKVVKKEVEDASGYKFEDYETPYDRQKTDPWSKSSGDTSIYDLSEGLPSMATVYDAARMGESTVQYGDKLYDTSKLLRTYNIAPVKVDKAAAIKQNGRPKSLIMGWNEDSGKSNKPSYFANTTLDEFFLGKKKKKTKLVEKPKNVYSESEISNLTRRK